MCLLFKVTFNFSNSFLEGKPSTDVPTPFEKDIPSMVVVLL